LPTGPISPQSTPGSDQTLSNKPEIYTYPSQFGTLILSIREGKDVHLFLYQPFLESSAGAGFTALPLTRITTGPQQDITPSISPDGSKIAFSSNRNGPWDIYILDLLAGETWQFTDTSAYDGNPTWSPDGQWLAYESYHLNNLEIIIQDINQTSGPIPLTNHPGADYAPSWSGHGRRISFVSTRSGVQEIWYADLDSREEDKAVRVKNLPGQAVKHPTWSSDGRYLTWAVITQEGNHSLVTWDSQYPGKDPVLEGTGDWPIWSGSGEILFSIVERPFDTYLTGYPGFQGDFQIMLPAIQLPGPVEGISWVEGLSYSLQSDLNQGPEPTALWNPINQTENGYSEEKKSLIQLRNLTAPSPKFIQDAVGSFSSLQMAVENSLGWDFLSTLENAYVAPNTHVPPGINLDWLYTGRGLMINDIPRQANWMVLVKEDYICHTYWRVYVRANTQQGLHGQPLHDYPWDFNARYSGSNLNYENGGTKSKNIPPGYWVDFTELAEAYGWHRFPAESYWQFSELASRYQYFAFTQHLELRSALLQLYSASEIQDLDNSPNP
ncbi:MAG: hypothetical protein MUO54_04110, partial [Anaerolineales bacterium]|nr:hypothetical protein [Anaerolineales bacterium]